MVSGQYPGQYQGQYIEGRPESGSFAGSALGSFQSVGDVRGENIPLQGSPPNHIDVERLFAAAVARFRLPILRGSGELEEVYPGQVQGCCASCCCGGPPGTCSRIGPAYCSANCFSMDKRKYPRSCWVELITIVIYIGVAWLLWRGTLPHIPMTSDQDFRPGFRHMNGLMPLGHRHLEQPLPPPKTPRLPGMPEVRRLAAAGLAAAETGNSSRRGSNASSAADFAVIAGAPTSEAARTLLQQESYDCDNGFADWRNMWSIQKRAWCCHHRDRGCIDLYDCTADFEDWRHGWSLEKKSWCCRNEHRACTEDNEQSYDCSSGSYGLPATGRDWCCRHQEKFCEDSVSQKYDCEAGYSNWQNGWSIRKKAWCCHAQGRGCGVTTSQPYDCEAGFSNWRDGWSLGKKAWCCHNEGRGCHHTTQRYDCEAGYSNWQDGWSLPKKEWCCHTHNRGCEHHTSLLPGEGTTSAPYDCEAGYSNWHAGWSYRKKVWCCTHHSRGCGEVTTSQPYDCEAGFVRWRTGWSRSKKNYCCQHAGRGCGDTGHHHGPYDCHAGYADWPASWSVHKRVWCCQYEQRGCGKVHGQVSQTQVHHDCNLGYNQATDRATGWSMTKAAWCCSHVSRGCRDGAAVRRDGYHCDVGFSHWSDPVTGWSVEKVAWCCSSTGRGCHDPHEFVLVNYNCDHGYNHWDDPDMGWSREKSDWCCSHKHRGCGHSIARRSQHPLYDHIFRRHRPAFHHLFLHDDEPILEETIVFQWWIIFGGVAVCVIFAICGAASVFRALHPLLMHIEYSVNQAILALKRNIPNDVDMLMDQTVNQRSQVQSPSAVRSAARDLEITVIDGIERAQRMIAPRQLPPFWMRSCCLFVTIFSTPFILLVLAKGLYDINRHPPWQNSHEAGAFVCAAEHEACYCDGDVFFGRADVVTVHGRSEHIDLLGEISMAPYYHRRLYDDEISCRADSFTTLIGGNTLTAGVMHCVCTPRGFVRHNRLLWEYFGMAVLLLFFASWPVVCWLSNQMIAAVENKVARVLLMHIRTSGTSARMNLQSKIDALDYPSSDCCIL